ncbi:zinc-binding alcohol dehydrogenase family protein [Sphingomonas sp. MS122]|uniref:zinc-binding alcohol dehydrogenase family protein n=1 Tax=Sphingomonas sp. MS122 TaxID=3412683 RepID=UPI003C2C9D63
MTMQAIVCEQPGTLSLVARPRPERLAGEVLLRIRRVGMCGTDYHIFRGTQPYLAYPRVMGHELAGEVIEGDEGGRFAAGQIVCVMPYLSCGTCIACRRGKTNCCVNIQVLGVHRDGGLAEYLAVDARFVIDAAGLTLDQAAMVEFLAIGRHAVERAALDPGRRVLVAGAGPIGMAVTLFAAQRGAEVTVLDGNRARARFCVERLGASAIITLDEDVPARVAALTEDDGFSAVFDATGSPTAIEAGFAHVAHGGTYVLVSIVAADIRFSDPEFHKREMTLMGSRNATIADFEAVIAAIRAGAVPVGAMHTHSAPLARLPDMIEGWMRPEARVIKAIVEV